MPLTSPLVSEDKEERRCHFFALRLVVDAFFTGRVVLPFRLVDFFAADFLVVFADFFTAFLAAFFMTFLLLAFAGGFAAAEPDRGPFA